jgi:hypothetical protein
MTTRLGIPCPDRPDLDALIKRAVAEFNSWPREKQIAHRRAQRKSWVVGEMMLEHPEMTREAAEKLYDEVEAGVFPVPTPPHEGEE